MTDHPEQPKPSLVERLTIAQGRCIDWKSCDWPACSCINKMRAVQTDIRELVAYLREMPEEIAHEIGLAVHNVYDFPAKTYLQRCGEAAAAIVAKRLEKEAE